jgi:hypothetical protein
MLKPTHSISLTNEEIKSLEYRLPYIQMYRLLRSDNIGVEIFEPDGKSDGMPGLYYLEMLLSFFEAEESYEKCIRIRDWIVEFHERWSNLCSTP